MTQAWFAIHTTGSSNPILQQKGSVKDLKQMPLFCPLGIFFSSKHKFYTKPGMYGGTHLKH